MMNDIIVKFVLCHKTHTCYCWSLLLLSHTQHLFQNLVLVRQKCEETSFSQVIQLHVIQLIREERMREQFTNAAHYSTQPVYNPVYISTVLCFTFDFVRTNSNFQLELTSLSGSFSSFFFFICFRSTHNPFWILWGQWQDPPAVDV